MWVKPTRGLFRSAIDPGAIRSAPALLPAPTLRPHTGPTRGARRAARRAHRRRSTPESRRSSVVDSSLADRQHTALCAHCGCCLSDGPVDGDKAAAVRVGRCASVICSAGRTAPQRLALLPFLCQRTSRRGAPRQPKTARARANSPNRHQGSRPRRSWEGPQPNLWRCQVPSDRWGDSHAAAPSPGRLRTRRRPLRRIGRHRARWPTGRDPAPAHHHQVPRRAG